MNASHYDWNLQLDLGGVTFTGPGMETEAEAERVKEIVLGMSHVEAVQVVKQ